MNARVVCIDGEIGATRWLPLHKLNQNEGGIHMARQYAVLQCIVGNEPITAETHYAFLYHLQSAMLLALRERGRLNVMQHRHAEEKLNQQRRDRAKHILEKGEGT